MISLLISFSTIATPLQVTEITYGTSFEGRDLTSKIIHLKSRRPIKAVILTEGTHGNEYIGFVDGIEKHILKGELTSGFKNYLNNGGSLILIPKVNMDGVHNRTRHNVPGLDLNRKFTKKNQNFDEATQLVSFLKKYLKNKEIEPLFAVDYHCCGGKALKPTIDKNPAFYNYLENSMQFHLGSKYKVINTKELFGKVFEGTLKDYFSKNFNVPAITFEAASLFNNSVKNQVALWDNLLLYFSSEEGKILASNQLVKDKDSIAAFSNKSKKNLSE